MTYLVVCSVALVASGLTFFSGFGLGTLLLPAFALFFPVEHAVALTAVVHFLNNLFKLALVGRHADRRVVVRFGIPAILAAVVRHEQEHLRGGSEQQARVAEREFFQRLIFAGKVPVEEGLAYLHDMARHRRIREG